MAKTKMAFLFLLVLMTAIPLACMAEAYLVVSTDVSVENVALMDEDGQSLSRVISSEQHSDRIDWTLLVHGGSDESRATLYERDSAGNWNRTSKSFDLSALFTGGSQTVQAPSVTAASAAKWPVDPYQAYSTSVYPLPQDERYQSRTGPSRTYHGGGAYKTYKISSIKALFIEDGYVLAELDYTTVGRRRLYFAERIFQNLSGVPEVTLTSYGAKTTVPLTPYFGPGTKYNSFDEAAISANTALDVFFEEDGWVFAEFDSALGPVRAWIPAESIALTN